MMPACTSFRPRVANLALASSAIVLSLSVSHSVSAASLSATVSDEFDGQPIEGAYLYLYLWDPINEWWEGYDEQRSDADGDVAFSDLPGGTYYAETYAYVSDFNNDCYIAEYYDDARDWQDRTDFTLEATDSKTLNPIELARKPVCFKDLTSEPYSLPPNGGTVTLSGTVVNNTSLTPEVTYWVNMYTYIERFEAHSNFTLVGPGQFTLPAGETPFALDVQVPAEAPVGQWYDFTLTVGLSPWYPAANGWFGGISKYSEGEAASASPPARGSMSPLSSMQSQRIPHRISADGTVLEWR